MAVTKRSPSRRRDRSQGIERIASFTVTAVFILLVLSLIPGDHSDIYARGQDDNDTVVIGFTPSNPLIYQNSQGALKGIIHDILEEIAVLEGWDLQYRSGTREEVVTWLDAGEIDIGAGIEETADLSVRVNFTESSIITTWGVVYSADDLDIGSLFDLQDRWIGIVRDDIYYGSSEGIDSILESFGITSYFVEFDNYNEVIEGIEKGTVDAGILNRLLGTVTEADRDIKRTGIIFNPLDLKFITAMNSSSGDSLGRRLDVRMGELKEDPDSVYYGTIENYLDREISEREVFVIPSWVINLLLILVGLVAAFIGISLFLRHRVRVKTKEIRETNDHLRMEVTRRMKDGMRLMEERNRSFFYLDLLVHDMGNIHQGLLGSAQLYQHVKDDRNKADRIVGNIEDLVHRSVNLVNNVNKLTTIMSTPPEPQVIDIAPLIKLAAESVILSFPEKRVTHHFHSDLPAIKIMAEPVVEEVFHNLYHNALRYQSSMEPEIWTKICRDELNVVIEISDSGRGVDDQMKEIIFKRYKKSIMGKHSGTGLSLVKALVERYNGSIKVEDRIEGDYSKGTKFIIKFPLMD
ncbi:MAG: ATP-binding protein [Thermoplasmatota archaeon]